MFVDIPTYRRDEIRCLDKTGSSINALLIVTRRSDSPIHIYLNIFTLLTIIDRFFMGTSRTGPVFCFIKYAV